MSKIWFSMIIVSLLFLTIKNPSSILNEMLTSSASAFTLSLELCSVYVVWLGILEIVDASGLSEKIATLMRPLIKKIFKVDDPITQQLIAMNLSANMLGLGNASTPLAIKAINHMDTGNQTASFPIIMLIVINATSIQLLPTTIIALREKAGSLSSADIVLPTLITTVFTTILAIILVNLFSKIYNWRKK